MTSITKRLYESVVTFIRGDKNALKVETEVDVSLDIAETSEVMELVGDIKKISDSRKDRQAVYDRMALDSRVGSAIELMADEASQPDSVNGKIYWVESDDNEIAEILNQVLESIEYDKNSWNYLYQIIKSGEIFLKTFKDEFGKEEKLQKKLGFYFELVEDPLKISELTLYGETVGYYVKKTAIKKGGDEEEKGDYIYGIDEYVHIMSDRACKTKPVILTYTDPDSKEKVDKEFKVKYGTSFIDSAVDAFLIVEFIELLLLSVRFGRSQLYRLFQVEVGQASKGETANILRELKTKLAYAESIDKDSKSAIISKKPVPYGKNVYIPVRGGKGQIQQELIGGDFDIKNIVDIEYFLNKLYAALKVPKAYLGMDESVSGGIGNQSLSKIDARFARTVKKLKMLGCQGAEKILEAYCRLTDNEAYLNKFEVKTSELVTIDDLERKDDLANSVALASDLRDLLMSLEGVNLPPAEVTKIILEKILGLTGIEIDGEDDAETSE